MHCAVFHVYILAVAAVYKSSTHCPWCPRCPVTTTTTSNNYDNTTLDSVRSTEHSNTEVTDTQAARGEETIETRHYLGHVYEEKQPVIGWLAQWACWAGITECIACGGRSALMSVINRNFFFLQFISYNFRIKDKYNREKTRKKGK